MPDPRWSDEELRAVVVAYLQLRAAQASGRQASKTAARNSLLTGPLSRRTVGAIEFRMQNISAVLRDHGEPLVDGYIPADNVGPNVAARIWSIVQEEAVRDRVDRPSLQFVRQTFRWEGRRRAGGTYLLPNIADTGSESSMAISSALYDLLGISRTELPSATETGSQLETAVRDFLSVRLPSLDDRGWIVRKPGIELTESGQYSYFAAVRNLVKADPTLRAAIGLDYMVKPDVTVQLPRRFASAGDLHPSPNAPLLHACISCKWTLRSDRAQNVRTESAALIRHRAGRVPHIVVVTAEPTAGRIASLARGTGDVDAVYHVALPELKTAMRKAGCDAQADLISEFQAQGRLHDLATLPEVLADH